jgi:hypothetical protein
MSLSKFSGKYPDYIYIQASPNIIDISGMAGSWVDRRETPRLELAAQLSGCKLEPTNELQVSVEGDIAEIWLLSKAD